MANFNEKTSDFPKIETSIAKLGEILLELKQNLCNMHQKIEVIVSTPELQGSIKNYKEDIETRANEIETEVKWLRNEIKSIGDLL